MIIIFAAVTKHTFLYLCKESRMNLPTDTQGLIADFLRLTREVYECGLTLRLNSDDPDDYTIVRDHFRRESVNWHASILKKGNRGTIVSNVNAPLVSIVTELCWSETFDPGDDDKSYETHHYTTRIDEREMRGEFLDRLPTNIIYQNIVPHATRAAIKYLKDKRCLVFVRGRWAREGRCAIPSDYDDKDMPKSIHAKCSSPTLRICLSVLQPSKKPISTHLSQRKASRRKQRKRRQTKSRRGGAKCKNGSCRGRKRSKRAVRRR